MAEDCCVAGHLHAHAPGGAVETIAGRTAYVSRPAAPTHRAVLLLTDVFGHELPNNRRLADHFAEAGFLAVAPDLFSGDALPADALNGGRTPAVVEWFGRHSDVPALLAFVREVAAELRAKHGVTRIAAQGYCFGGRFAVLAAAEPPAVDAFAAAHPSRLVIPAEIAAVTKPGIFLLAGTDSMIPPELEATLRETAGALTAGGVEVVVRQWPGTTHGFAVRGSDSDASVVTARAEAFAAAVAFFQRVL